MKFLSNILATAGLVVDGVVTLNNTATGQTPNANDNSTKLATTAWVRTFVQPYSLPIASASVLGGIKVGNGLSIDATTGVLTASGGGNVGSFRSKQVFTATAAQTTFTVSGGYTPGFIDVFLNGVYINDDLYTATNSSTIVLDEAAALDDIITVFIYSPYYVGESPSSRDICTFTATAGQTTFSCSYVIGAVDVYYNGSKLAGSEFNASNGTTVVLNTACDVGDFVEVISWVAGGGLSSSRTITIDGVTQDLTANRTWSVLPTGGAAGDILAKVSATNYDVTWIPNFTSTVQHTVKAAVSLTKGQAVYVSSADGTNMIVSKASNASEQTSSKTLGLVAQNLAINGQGFVVTEGLLAGLDTSTAQAGDPVWLGTDGNLIFGLVNKPYAPAHLVFIGVVTRVQQNNGEIFVKVQNGFEFDELHNLSVRNASDGDMIKYVASTGLWTKIAATTTNITEGTNLYYTNARARTAISLTTSGTSGAATYDNTTGVLNIPQYQGGVTSFNTRTGAITLSSSDVTTALTYTPVTNARTLTINGTTYDLSADRSWSIAAGVTSFNTRTGAISLTSLDVTDALTYTPVTNARTLSINGTTYDLTANRSWTVGVNPSAREIQTFTATANQTTFTITGGYVVGLVDVFINGVRLTASDFTATNGTTVVLTTGTGVNNIVDVIKYTSAYIIDNALRQTTYFTATAGQTTFTVSYSPGLVDVFYNGSKLPSSEYTAVNGTTIVLTTPAILNDTIEVTAYNYTAGAFTGQAQLNGTGFVKVSGTTVSYDNSTYLTTSSASSTYQTILTNPVTGTGTSGQVAYWSSGSAITGEANLFWDATNDRLGIGLNNPAAEIQVGKASDVTIAMSNSSSVTSGIRGGIAWYNSNVSTVANIRAVAVTDNVGTELQFYTRPTAGSLTQVFTLASTGAATFQTTGNNGIINIGGSVYYSQLETNSTLGGLKIKSVWGAASSGIIQFINGTAENVRMHIADNGNIGIGNTEALVQLHLKDPNKNPSIRIDHSGGGNMFMKFQQFVGWNASMTFTSAYDYMGIDVTIPLVLNQSGSNVLIGTTTNTTGYKLQVNGNISISGNNYLDFNNGDSRIVNTSGQLSFQTYTIGSFATRMTITGPGNVGIGTSSINASSGYKMLRINGATTGGEIVLAGAEVEYAYMYANAGNFVIDALASQPMRFRTGAQNRMEISSAGAITMSVPTNGQTLTVFGKNNNWCEEIVGSSTTGQSYGLLVTAGTTSADYSFYVQNQAGTSPSFRVRGDSLVAFPKINDFTTGNSPNTWINPSSSYGIYINTSSIRYKRNIVNYDKGLTIVNQLRPVYYKGKSEVDGDKQFAGFIAEEIDELGLTEFVNYLEDGRPNSLSYPNMLALAVKAIQEQQEVIESLKSRIENLEQV